MFFFNNENTIFFYIHYRDKSSAQSTSTILSNLQRSWLHPPGRIWFFIWSLIWSTPLRNFTASICLCRQNKDKNIGKQKCYRQNRGIISRVIFLSQKKIGQNGGASWWRVYYQRGLPRLVFLVVVVVNDIIIIVFSSSF